MHGWDWFSATVDFVLGAIAALAFVLWIGRGA